MTLPVEVTDKPGWAGNAVELITMRADKGERLALVWLDGGTVRCDNQQLFDEWTARGIMGRQSRGFIFPRDGQAFLDELPFAYRGAYTWAEPVIMR